MFYFFWEFSRVLLRFNELSLSRKTEALMFRERNCMSSEAVNVSWIWGTRPCRLQTYVMDPRWESFSFFSSEFFTNVSAFLSTSVPKSVKQKRTNNDGQNKKNHLIFIDFPINDVFALLNFMCNCCPKNSWGWTMILRPRGPPSLFSHFPKNISTCKFQPSNNWRF